MLPDNVKGPLEAYFNYFRFSLLARSCIAAFTWHLSMKFRFGLLTVSTLCAKILHIYAHIDSLKRESLFLWGPTFFSQDAIFAVVVFGLTRLQRKWLQYAASMMMTLGTLIVTTMAAANASFYFTTGAEIHWRQAGGFNRDPASINTVLTGLPGFLIAGGLFVVTAGLTTPRIYISVEFVISTWNSMLKAVFRVVARRAITGSGKARRWDENPEDLERRILPTLWREREEAEDNATSTVALLVDRPPQTDENTRWTRAPTKIIDRKCGIGCKLAMERVLVIFLTLYIFFLHMFRPSNSFYWFLSQTVIITPFMGVDSESKLANMFKDRMLDGKRTALTAVPEFGWLPKDKYPGFRDWEDRPKSSHYNPTADPLHISNLDQPILSPIKEALESGDTHIKHIFLFMMESTRYDVFPLRNNTYLWDQIRKSYKNNEIPKDVQDRLINLTSTAERVTGSPSGFHGKEAIEPYGGINLRNSYTAGTFTLKSIEAAICGVEPLVVDFNHEYEHHIYQPCMPHILGMLSATTNNRGSENFTDWPWRPAFMQSITDTYDHQNRLIPAMGFPEKETVTMESIDRDRANDPSWTAKKFNFWGYPDSSLAVYVREAIEKAERDHERLFLTHLTGITHHPWDTPDGTYEELIGSRKKAFGGPNNDLNRYLNTIGVNDRWFQTVLDILEETGVASETLVVMIGDHGLSLPDDGGNTPYDNPLETNFHVPLVFAHPNFPAIQLDAAVSSIQILPTILDLLINSGGLDAYNTRVVRDLLLMYEGQSILRPIVTHTEKTSLYHFTVMNTGGSMVAMRSADAPYRLIIPLVPEAEFRFTDLSQDPREERAIKAFDLEPLKKIVEEMHGEDAANWIHDAAHAAQWWVTDNWNRYEYDARGRA